MPIMTPLYRRFIETSVGEACDDTPVVLLNGARQTGKTTLARQIIVEESAYRTLDDAATLAAATSDPQGFIQNAPERVVIDEVQRAPELFSAIKLSVDRDRRPGRFLLTGSANVLLLPRLSESLAGRMEILTLWPLSQSEIAGSESAIPYSIADWLFSGQKDILPAPPNSEYPSVSRRDWIERLLIGGFPEALRRSGERRRNAWFASYITALLQRDVRELAQIEGIAQLPPLLALLASRTAGLLNLSDIAGTLGIAYATLHRYMALLEATYLVQRIPAWSGNLGLRLVKSPKVMLCDTGLVAYLLNLDTTRLERDGALLGALLENFVAMEMQKHISWSQTQPALYHWRTQARQEVDLLLEQRGGVVVGIEIKASSSVSEADFKGLRALRESLGDRFFRGAIFYSGQVPLPFGDRLFAIPLSVLA